MRRAILFLLLAIPQFAQAGSVLDATGRWVPMPAQATRVLPAGPPAAVLLLAVAPDLMLGYPFNVSGEARGMLSEDAQTLPSVPRLTGKDDQTDAIKALRPDLILDYGTVSKRYIDLTIATQDRTGVPTVLLDGALAETPRTLRLLGTMLHREARAETLARLAEALLDAPSPAQGKTPSVVYARGADGLTVVAPDTGASEIFTALHWRVLAPAGEGWFRHTDIKTIAALDPDILVFSDPAMREVLATSEAWRALRAVREGHAYVAPNQPFSWVEDPPSINRLLGLAWLRGRDPATLAPLFNAGFYGRALTPKQLDTLLLGVTTIHP